MSNSPKGTALITGASAPRYQAEPSDTTPELDGLKYN